MSSMQEKYLDYVEFQRKFMRLNPDDQLALLPELQRLKRAWMEVFLQGKERVEINYLLLKDKEPSAFNHRSTSLLKQRESTTIAA
jgi:hypothetical protein